MTLDTLILSGVGFDLSIGNEDCFRVSPWLTKLTKNSGQIWDFERGGGGGGWGQSVQLV